MTIKLPGPAACPVPQTTEYVGIALLWRHNARDGVSDHQPHDCLLNRASDIFHMIWGGYFFFNPRYPFSYKFFF